MQYYGIDLVSNNDEDSDDKVSDQVFEDLQVQITSNQQTMVQHDAINVPDFPSPHPRIDQSESKSWSSGILLASSVN